MHGLEVEKGLTLSAVLDLKGGFLTLAGGGLVTAGSLDTVDSVDAAMGEAFGVLEK